MSKNTEKPGSAAAPDLPPMCACGDHSPLCPKCGLCLLVCCECEGDNGESREWLSGMRAIEQAAGAGKEPKNG